MRLLECLTPTFSLDIFVDNYFISFYLLTHLGVKNICVTEIDYAHILLLGEAAAKKVMWVT